ncbi:tigger transposable element-derived protein 6-like [Ornithodoros turicata]|uniref:tigger transposable element-derived protein 6-like n=1 Tax=Ornithodoros turicata TaxID=34597 RepID=UPI0031399479
MASASSGSQLKRKAISLETKHSILDDHRSGIPVKTLVTKYGLSQPTVSTIIRNRDKILASATLDGASGKRKRMWGAALPDVEAALYKWFLEVCGRNIPVSGAVLTAKAKQLAFLMEHKGFSPGNGWLHRFKERHGIRFKKIVGEAASADISNIDEWMDMHAAKIASYDERDVFNADETALFFQLLPSHTHALRNETCAGGKHSKVRVTVLLCCNMDGSDRQKLFVIGKSAKPRDFRSLYSLPVHYRSNSKAWMTKVLGPLARNNPKCNTWQVLH